MRWESLILRIDKIGQLRDVIDEDQLAIRLQRTQDSFVVSGVFTHPGVRPVAVGRHNVIISS